MARQRGAERVLGPYATGGGRWRVVAVGEDGRRVDQTFADEAEARRVATAARKRLAEAQRGGLTLAAVIDSYEVVMREERKNRETSWAETTRRLRLFFSEHLDDPVASVTPARCERAYERLRAYVSPRTKRRLADDSQLNTLAEAKTFTAWLVKRKHLVTNPLEKVEPVGRRSYHNKTQLRVDEAKRWVAVALDLADGGDEGALGALMALLLGLRAGEVTKRVVRDVDEGGGLIWVPTSKTKSGVRQVETGPLRPYLQELVEGRRREAPLFEARTGGHHAVGWVRQSVKRICALAGTPRVTAHGMRGAHTSLAGRRGTTVHEVAAAVGHHSPSVTLASYMDPGAYAAGITTRLGAVLGVTVDEQRPTVTVTVDRHGIPEEFRGCDGRDGCDGRPGASAGGAAEEVGSGACQPATFPPESLPAGLPEVIDDLKLP